jgi:hypothetical protein
MRDRRRLFRGRNDLALFGRARINVFGTAAGADRPKGVGQLYGEERTNGSPGIEARP